MMSILCITLLTKDGLNKGGVANAPHADFAVGVLTPPLTKGMLRPFGNPSAKTDSSPPQADGALSGSS